MDAVTIPPEYFGLKELRDQHHLFERDDPVLTRYEMIREYLTMSQSAEKVGKRYGFSGSALYYWLKRFKEMGMIGLVGEKTGPKGPIKVTDEVEERILQLRRERDSSITEIADVLKKEDIDVAYTTVDRVLSQNGIPKKKRGRKSKNHNS